MIGIVYISAILAAVMNAASSVIQRWATHKPEAIKLFGSRFAYDMLKSRLFMIGFALQVVAFAAQAIALINGPLIVVEPLLTSDLIFLLLIINWRLGIRMKMREWIAAAAIIGGLAGLFMATDPKGGRLNYHATPWIILLLVVTPIIITLALTIRHLNSPKLRALFASLAAATTFALNASFTKLSLNIMSEHGVMAMLTSWPILALIISGVTSLYLMMNAFGSGPLAISQPVMEVTEPTIAVIIGVLIFGDSYDVTPVTLSIGLVCILILITGIILLGSSPRVQMAGERGI